MSISVNSPVRCGSTLIYNIVKEIYPNVIKSHANCFRDSPENKVRTWFTMDDNSNKVIFVLRHPFDSIISISQCNKLNIHDPQVLERCIYEYAISLKPFKQYNKSHILKLKYEIFYNNYDYIINTKYKIIKNIIVLH